MARIGLSLFRSESKDFRVGRSRSPYPETSSLVVCFISMCDVIFSPTLRHRQSNETHCVAPVVDNCGESETIIRKGNDHVHELGQILLIVLKSEISEKPSLRNKEPCFLWMTSFFIRLYHDGFQEKSSLKVIGVAKV